MYNPRPLMLRAGRCAEERFIDWSSGTVDFV